MRKRLLLIVAASILVASTLVGCPSSSALTILSVTEGEVSVMKAGTDNWVEAQVGMSLEPGDMIKTGDDSNAEITFFDGSTIELQAGTEIEVVALDFAADTGSTDIRLKQSIGNTIFRVTKIVDPASRYEVETPTGVASVRGSAMEVYVTEDGTTLVTNLEGDIWAAAQGVELQIPEGERCIIRPDEPPELVSEEVTFADPNLEAAVREAIAMWHGPIYAEDMERLNALNAEGRNISDLSGLEYATSLTELWLRDNQISDISALAGLTSLASLGLEYNQIGDISPLGGLTNLTRLGLGHNQISDISPLEGMTNLTFLGLWSNQISVISPLERLTNLIDLYLEYNRIGDISPLVSFPKLQGLGLSGHQISDISLLVDLAELSSLNLPDSQISDISLLADLANLTSLGLSDNQISDVSPLANLTGLRELFLGNNQVSDISPLAGLRDLTDLYLPGNLISDISALEGLNNLTRINLEHNQITDMSALAGLTSLTWLGLGNNQISDISPLVDNPGLGEGDEVVLTDNPLSEESINEHIPELEARGVTVVR